MASAAAILHTEGSANLLQVWITEVTEPPANFYLGLCNDTLVIGDTLALIANEPSGSGYARVALPSSVVGFTIAASGSDNKATSAACAFTASGGTIGPVDTVFLGTTVDNTGKLLMSAPLSQAFTMPDGSSLTVSLVILAKKAT